MKNKPTWVFVAGTYRSGSTTQYRITRDVVEQTNNGIGIGYHNERRLKDFDSFSWSDMQAIQELYAKHDIECNFSKPPKFERESPYIVCKVFEYLPDGFREGTSHGEIIARQNRMKVIISVRDPRDIIVSMRNRTRELPGKVFDFEDHAKVKFPEWFSWLTKWADSDEAMVSKFEDFTINLYRETAKISNYLRVRLSSSKAKSIAKEYKPDNIRKTKDEYWQKRGENPELREDPALPSIPALLFASSGQWQHELTEKEADMVYFANEEFFERFGYVR